MGAIAEQHTAVPVGTPHTPRPATGAALRAARVAGIAAFFAGTIVFSIPLCPFALLTRHPCPGCGLTRATLALMHGHVADALHFHPLSIVVAPLVVVAVGYNVALYVWAGKTAAAEALQGPWVTRLAAVLAVIMVAVWIARFFGAFGGPVPV